MTQRVELELHTVESDQFSSSDLRHFLRMLYRHKGKVFVFFTTVMVGVTLYTIFSKRVYRAESKLFVRLGRENSTLDPTATLGQASAIVPAPSRENEINSLAELLKSRGLLEKVVDRVGPSVILDAHPDSSPGALQGLREMLVAAQLLPELSERDRAIIKIGEELVVEPVTKSNVIAISYDGYNREGAQSIVTTLVDLYLKQHVELNRNPGAHEFFAEQTERLRTGLARREEQLRDLKNTTGIVSLEGRRDLLLKELEQLQSELHDAVVAAAASEVEVQQLSAELASLPETRPDTETNGIGDYGTDLMRGQLYSVQLQEEEMGAKFTESHPELRQVRAKAAAAKGVLSREERTRRQTATAPSRTHEETEIVLLREKPRLASWKTKVSTLEKRQAELERRLQTFNTNEVAIRDLQREIDVQDSKYRKYSESLEQSRIDQALETQRICNIGVAQAATCQPKPVRPRAALNLLAGLGLGLFGGIALAWMAECGNRSLKTAEELQKKLGLPYLASIPRLKAKQMPFVVRN
jgi:uncharacterized protein involved in exopolysaccharide biosynthesis